MSKSLNLGNLRLEIGELKKMANLPNEKEINFVPKDQSSNSQDGYRTGDFGNQESFTHFENFYNLKEAMTMQVKDLKVQLAKVYEDRQTKILASIGSVSPKK